ncbi:MAG: hypothetical protein JSS22_06020 [Proteobacteria bacterium]|nr:hypothetical protein [Pseudomonadota bacterium]
MDLSAIGLIDQRHDRHVRLQHMNLINPLANQSRDLRTVIAEIENDEIGVDRRRSDAVVKLMKDHIEPVRVENALQAIAEQSRATNQKETLRARLTNRRQLTG